MNRAELGGKLLQSVSRSFYLSLRLLPSAVREPVGLAYLLARISDTLADTADVPCAVRLEALTRFQASLTDPGHWHLPVDIRPANPAEQRLLRHVPEALEWLMAIPSSDRLLIHTVLGEIIQGQRTDLTRTWPVQNREELEQYIYSVAGCVGEFWTSICQAHLRNYSPIDSAALRQLGVEFGKGLQLVNVLRDFAEDAGNGRVYLPGTTPEEWSYWHQRAHSYLESAYRYIKAIRPWRVRLACILPWALGVMTLNLLPAASIPRGSDPRQKVSRRTVRQLSWKALPASVSGSTLEKLRDKCLRYPNGWRR